MKHYIRHAIITPVVMTSVTGTSFFLQFVPSTAPELHMRIFLGVYIYALFGMIWYWIWNRLIQPRFARWSIRERIVRVITAVAAGLCIVLITPLELPPSWEPQLLTITATGRSNPLSAGQEVWIMDFTQVDGTTIAPETWQVQSGWERRDGQLVAYEHLPATIVWEGILKQDVRIVLLLHQWSGIAEITWNGASREIDLYADPARQQVIELPVASFQPAWVLQSLYLGSMSWLTFVIGVVLQSISSVRRLWVPGLAAITTAYSIVLHTVLPLIDAPAQYFLIGCTIAGLFWLLWRRIWSRFVVSWLSSYTRRQQFAWGLGSILLGLLLVLVIPVQLPTLPTWHHLEITATGTRNPASEGSEVWVQALRNTNNTPIPLKEFQATGNWQLRDNQLMAYRDFPARLQWSSKRTTDMQVVLLAHPWSGIAEISWNGRKQFVDLYASEGRSMVIDLPASPEVLPWVMSIPDVLSIAWLALCIGLFLTTKPIPTMQPTPKIGWLWYALPCMAVWSIYLLAFWPGMMSSDSIDQWTQITRGVFNNWHPIPNTLLWWGVTRIWFSPGAVVIAQIIALALVFAAAMRELEHWAVPLWVRLLLTGLFSISLPNSLLVLTLWKDIPYAIAILGGFLILLKAVRTSGTWLTTRSGIVWSIFVFTITALMRHNGWPIVVSLCVALFLINRRLLLRPVGIIGSLTLLFIFITLGSINQLLNIASGSQASGITAIQVHQVGAIINHAPHIPAQHLAFLNEIQPIDIWKSHYSCYTLNDLFYNPYLNSNLLISEKSRFNTIWLDLIISNPTVLITHQLCTSAIVWHILSPTDSFVSTYFDGIYTNTLGLQTTPILPNEGIWLRGLLKWSIQPQQIWWIWRPAIYLYLAIGVICLLAIRLRSWKVLLCSTPVLINSFILMLTIPSPSIRYQYPVYLIALVTIGLLFVRRNIAEESATTPSPDHSPTQSVQALPQTAGSIHAPQPLEQR